MNWPSLRVSKADILSGIPLSECKNSLLWTMCIMINLKSSIHVSSLVDSYDAVAVNCYIKVLTIYPTKAIPTQIIIRLLIITP